MTPWGRLRAIVGTVAVCSSLSIAPLHSSAQEPAPPGARYSPAQLDQMLAPIALYPDGLLGQILMAATYPLDIVEADRWLQDPDNAALRGTQLVQALQPLPWDPSVKSLVAFPQVLGVLDGNLEWTDQVGEAFIAQQREVMDHVQQLRRRAEAARTLVSTPQQVVSNDGADVQIGPADPAMLYVPVYDPDLVYGTWPYGDAPPYYFDMGGYFPGAFVGFAILAPLWGWYQWDWHGRGIVVNSGPAATSGAGRSAVHHVPWRHDPAHRGAVRYANAELQARYGAAQAARPATGASGRAQPPTRLSGMAPGLAPTRTVPPAASVPRTPGTGVAAPARNAAPTLPPVAPRAAPPPLERGTVEVHPHPGDGRAAESHAGESRAAEPRESPGANGSRDRR